MKKYVYLLALPLVLFCSCANDKPDEAVDTTPKAPYDSFKAGVQKLQRNGFLDKFKGQNLDSLTEVYRKDSVNGMKQMLIDAGTMLHIDICLHADEAKSDGALAPHEVYKVISDSIASRYPDLKADDMSYKYLPEFAGRKDTGWVLLGQQFGASWYKRKLYYFKDWPVDNFVYRMYNTLLADKNEGTRFFLVQFFLDKPDT